MALSECIAPTISKETKHAIRLSIMKAIILALLASPINWVMMDLPTYNVRVDAAARFHSTLAGPIILRNTLPPLASNDFVRAPVDCNALLSLVSEARALARAPLVNWPSLTVGLLPPLPAASCQYPER